MGDGGGHIIDAGGVGCPAGGGHCSCSPSGGGGGRIIRVVQAVIVVIG